MKLVRVRLRNFRCFKEELSIDISDLTALIGKNDSGKSSILDALDIFFNDSGIDSEDGSFSGDKEDVRIICEFEELPSSLVVDVNYPTTLENEYLLNEHRHLEIHKVYNCALKKPKLIGTYARAVHPTAEGFKDLLKLKRTELQSRANELGVDISHIDNRINAKLRRAIWDFAEALSLAPRNIPLDAEGAKQIWDQIKKELPVFSLFKSDRPSTDQDAEAQDPMKAAVKEAIRKKEDELNEITNYVIREVKVIADSTVNKIREMDPNLAMQLSPRFTPPKWENIFKISLTGEGEIPINKRGSGVRRLILLNFFRAKAEQQAVEKEASNIIYGVEEPETCQHPNNQRIIMHAFTELADQPDCQVIITTHTPTLGRLLPVEALYYLEIGEDEKRIIHSGDEKTYSLVSKALGVLPDHNVKLFIAVEGSNDINFLKNISKLLKQSGESVPDLSDLEDAGHIIFIPVGGSNLIHWTSRLENLNLREFHIYDRGAETSSSSPNKKAVEEINSRPECVAKLTGKNEMENYIHPDAIKTVWPEVEISFSEDDDVPKLVAEAVYNASESPKEWVDLEEETKKKKISRAKSWLNKEAVRAMTPQLLTESDPYGDVRSWLVEIQELLEQ